MRYVIVGNNDGPLRLFKALKKAGLPLPIFVGLQKTPDPTLPKDYKKYLGDIPFKTDFDEVGLIKILEPLKPEMVINCFCNFKFTDLLDSYRCYNVHPSYLPRYRGRHPLHWALINGEKEHGITIHEMSINYDDGPIIWQEKVALNENLSVAELRELLMIELETAFPGVFKDIMNNKVEKKFNLKEKSTYIKRRFPEDSKLVEWHDASQIYRKIKALSSEENPAFIQLESSEKLPIIDVTRTGKITLLKDNELPKLIRTEKNALLIATRDEQLLWLYTNENQSNLPKIDFTL